MPVIDYPVLVWLAALAAVLVVAGLYANLTNPFSRFSVVNDPLDDFDLDGDVVTMDRQSIGVRQGIVFRALAYFKSGWHIVANAWSWPSRRQKPAGVAEAIHAIHRLRFDPKWPFIISGDHFSVLYPRSLGIFYYSMLDPRIPSAKDDWTDRQRIYAKTLFYALKVFSQTDRLATTVVPVARRSVTLVNVYAYPSDTLYSLLTAFENLMDPQALAGRYVFASENPHELVTGRFAKQLLARYEPALKKHWSIYSRDVFDVQTGLIRRHMLLSGTKDIARRDCAFYDNVMYWRTWQLAQSLSLTDKDKRGLDELKRRILETFWDRDAGQFYEDLSSESLRGHLASSDWLIAYQTGFLSPDRDEDVPYLAGAVESARASKLDEPFGLAYHRDLRLRQLYLPVRIGAPLYGSQTIWSHWGMEYTKLLAHLGTRPQYRELRELAAKQCEAYERNIAETGGYPEVYGPDGKPYSHYGYTSVYRTGWVVNFEQTREMVKRLAETH